MYHLPDKKRNQTEGCRDTIEQKQCLWYFFRVVELFREKICHEKSRTYIVAETKEPGSFFSSDLSGFQKICQNFGAGWVSKKESADKSIKTRRGKPKIFSGVFSGKRHKRLYHPALDKQI